MLHSVHTPGNFLLDSVSHLRCQLSQPHADNARERQVNRRSPWPADTYHPGEPRKGQSEGKGQLPWPHNRMPVCNFFSHLRGTAYRTAEANSVVKKYIHVYHMVVKNSNSSSQIKLQVLKLFVEFEIKIIHPIDSFASHKCKPDLERILKGFTM